LSLSICCQWLEPRTKRDGSVIYENSIKEKILQLGAYNRGKYDGERINGTYHNNLDELIKLVPKLIENNIKSFRVSSNVLPLFDQTGDVARNDESLKEKFRTLGKLFLDNDIRVTTHPGQFTVISSDRDSVIENAIKELQYHAWMFDQMGLPQTPYHAINIHGGKRDRADRMVETILSLPEGVRKRLTLENDERCYNPKQLLKVSEKTGIPIVWDSHHHVFNDGGMTMEEAMWECAQTWGDTKPLQHISNTTPGMENGSYTERRKHSYYIHYIPDVQREVMEANVVDVDVEAKGKNLALLKMRQDFKIKV
jgi:UV DNA damage endonuclease